MKFTGITMVVIGMASLLFSGVMATQADNSHTQQDFMMPLIGGVLALTAGALMLAFGGRGYFASRNLATRN